MSKIINEDVKDVFFNYQDALIHSFVYFIRKHIESTQNFLDYSIKNIIDFCGFCCIKTQKNLQSIEVLLDNGLAENIYATNRSIYESYLYVLAFNQNPDLFNEKILPKLNDEEYSFKISPNGKINYNEVIHKKTNETINLNLTIKELAKMSPYSEDIDLYNLFYRLSSQFVHVDVLSAKSYFYEHDPFQEVDQSLIAATIGITFSVLLIEQMGILSNTIFKSDIAYFVKKSKPELVMYFNLIYHSPLCKNEVLLILIDRLQK